MWDISAYRRCGPNGWCAPLRICWAPFSRSRWGMFQPQFATAIIECNAVTATSRTIQLVIDSLPRWCLQLHASCGLAVSERWRTNRATNNAQCYSTITEAEPELVRWRRCQARCAKLRQQQPQTDIQSLISWRTMRYKTNGSGSVQR